MDYGKAFDKRTIGPVAHLRDHHIVRSWDLNQFYTAENNMQPFLLSVCNLIKIYILALEILNIKTYMKRVPVRSASKQYATFPTAQSWCVCNLIKIHLLPLEILNFELLSMVSLWRQPQGRGHI